MANRIPNKVILAPDNCQIIRAVALFYLDPADNLLTEHFFDNTAIVTATLFDQYSNPVAGCTDLVLNYVAGSLGNFTGVVGRTFAPAVGTGYNLLISADQGAAHGEWDLDCEIALRTN